MKKKLAFVLAGVIALSSFAVGALSRNIVEKIEAELRGDFTVYIDGKKQTFRDANGNAVDPVLYEGTTYLPIRAIGEIMGKTVYWYQDEKKIELVEPSQEEVLVTDADVIVDGSEKAKPENKIVNDNKVKDNKNAEVGITLEEAKAIALEKAGVKEADAVFTKAKLDYDDGRYVYDVDFKTDAAKYDAEVDAVTGAVTEWEVEEKAVSNNANTAAEKITADEAKAIALARAGLDENDVTFVKAEYDRGDGRDVYEIEFRQGRVEYEAEVNAANGKIVEWNVDNDD